MMKGIFLAAILVINCTGFSLGASVAKKIEKLDSVIKDLEREVEVLAELKDESSKQKRVVMHMGTQESIAEVNAHAHTDEQIQQYCASHNGCGLQGGDEILTKKQFKIEKEDNENAKKAKQGLTHDPIKEAMYRWPKINGRVVVPYRFKDGDFEGYETRVIQKAMDEYAELSCVDWVVATDTSKHYVEFIKGGGCYSYVGKVNLGTGKQPISIGNGCAYHGTVVHEMLHCMGFFHEQSRPDRDEYVQIYLENLQDSRFKNNFDKQEGINTLGEPYDIGSVMHYGPTYFAKSGKYTILKKVPNQASVVFQPNRQGFSATDLRQLNKLYQCPQAPGPETTQAPEPVTTPVVPPSPVQPETTPAPTPYVPDPTCLMMLDLGFCRYSKISEACPYECDAPEQEGYIANVRSDNKCNRWAGQNFCNEDNKYHKWMKINCLKSCINHKYSAVPQEAFHPSNMSGL